MQYPRLEVIAAASAIAVSFINLAEPQLFPDLVPAVTTFLVAGALLLRERREVSSKAVQEAMARAAEHLKSHEDRNRRREGEEVPYLNLTGAHIQQLTVIGRVDHLVIGKPDEDV